MATRRSTPGRQKAARRPPSSSPAESPSSPPPPVSPRLFPIVGVGASAGGLDALRQLLPLLSDQPGVALVLVTHLEPHHHSYLAELLAGVSPMPVKEIVDGMLAETNQVYVLPSAFFLAIDDGVLRLTPRAAQRLPIDFFLASLAKSHRERAVGVVLSGTGSDGTLGLQAVRAAGGLTFAQEPASAGHDGMPRSAVDAGAVDFVLPIEGIARELVRLGQRQTSTRGGAAAAAAGATGRDAESWNKILLLLSRATGTDFSLYKRATLERRMERRMAACGIATLEQYARYLEEKAGEADALHQEFLINVTYFFRDPEAIRLVCERIFEALDTKAPASPPVRVWLAGCSTGEEVYSLAISLLERAGERTARSPGFQIFATDLSEKIVARARAGIFPESIAERVSEERLQRFFTKVDNHYQVSRVLRDLCVFARQDVTRDPPFSRVDVVCCCNLLIYFEPRLQERVLAIFHYALNPGGILLLGPSESAAAAPALFEALDKRHRIYLKKPVAGIPAMRFLERGGPPRGDRGSVLTGLPERASTSRAWAPKEADRLLLSRYTPAGVIVDERYDILEFRGDTSAYLRHIQGSANLNLMKMVHRDLYVALRQALDEAQKQAAPVCREGVRLRHQRSVSRISIEAIPLLGPAASRCTLVLFTPSAGGQAQDHAPQPPALGAESRKDVQGSEARCAQLEQELSAAAEYLRTVLLDNEVAREDLQASNEELLSANEEFLSLNEELETAKEELQSVNEELATLNQELRDRNLQLGRLNDDLLNLLESTSTVALMVDSALCLRRFTPDAETLLNLRPADLGRPLAALPTQLTGELEADVRQVIENVSVQEREVRTAGGSTFLLRIRPYRTQEKTIDGAVVVLFDVTDLKRGAETVRRALEEAATEREALLALEQLARERAELADHVKDEFLATISHELRGPLQAMIGWTTVLQTGGDAGRLAQGLSAIERGIRTQLRLIEDLLDHSRIVAGQLKLAARDMDLAAVADLAIDTLRMAAEAKQIRLDLVRSASPEGFRMVGDPDRLQQVVHNLVGNAVKFTPPGGRVQVRLECVSTGIQLIVADTGTGIPPSFLPHVFERFRQAEGTPNRRYQGLGLGLAIVRQLVELHGGTVRAESAGEGQGAKFTVWLPLSLVLSPLVSALSGSPAAPTDGAASLLDGLRVLIVEDDGDSREALGALLEQQGVHVVAAASTPEAIVSLEAELPDLIVSDIGMSGLDGYELIAMVRQRSAERGGRLPALALTGYADPMDAERALAAGFQMHLAKPVHLAQLLHALAQLAGRLDAGAAPADRL